MDNLELRTVNMDKVLNDPRFSSLTKSVVHKIRKLTYFTLVEFLKEISDIDLQSMIENIDRMNSSTNIAEDLIILNELLCIAEGILVESDSESYENLYYFINVIHCESLKRKGFVDIDYTKISFDPSFKDEIFAKLRE